MFVKQEDNALCAREILTVTLALGGGFQHSGSYPMVFENIGHSGAVRENLTLRRGRGDEGFKFEVSTGL